jgi:hypothetical protein
MQSTLLNTSRSLDARTNILSPWSNDGKEFSVTGYQAWDLDPVQYQLRLDLHDSDGRGPRTFHLRYSRCLKMAKVLLAVLLSKPSDYLRGNHLLENGDTGIGVL